MEQSVVQLTGEGARVSIMKSAVIPPVEKEKEREERGDSQGDSTMIVEIVNDDEVREEREREKRRKKRDLRSFELFMNL